MEASTGTIAAERQRQIAVEGWTAEHDDVHANAELVEAARAYAWVALCEVAFAAVPADFVRHVPNDWPKDWKRSWFKPRDPVRNLVKAGALIAAEIDRLQRNRSPHMNQGE